jgi:uncharacterized protein
MRFVIVPGIEDSDSAHWQSIWQAEWGPIAVRIAPTSWSTPDLDDWITSVDRAVALTGTDDVVLIAHSLGCLGAAAWLAESPRAVRAAFLVAPPDPHGPEFPAAAASFEQFRPDRLGVPGLVVASLDDPYCRPGTAATMAQAWGLPLARIGAFRHLNSASGVGGWQQGRVLLAKLLGSTASAVA